MNITKTGVAISTPSTLLHDILNNPCETETSTDWSFGGDVSISSGLVQLTGVNPSITSSSFSLGVDDIIVFEFSVSLPTPSTTTSNPGLYLGSTKGVSTKTYIYSDGVWSVSSSGTTNPYFLRAYNSSNIISVKTYILGTNVNINSVPGIEKPSSQTIYALQPLSGSSTNIRSGYNSNTSMVINLYNLKLYKINYCGICENNNEASFGKGYLSFNNYIEI